MATKRRGKKLFHFSGKRYIWHKWWGHVKSGTDIDWLTSCVEIGIGLV